MASLLISSLTRQSFFDAATFSDVTIRCGATRIQAHKIILAQGSDYFKAAFTGGFKVSRGRSTTRDPFSSIDTGSQEAEESVFELKDDDEDAVKGMIAHLYGVQAGDVNETPFRDKMSSALDHHEQTLERSQEFACVSTSVDLYVVARKYQVNELVEEILIKFPHDLQQLVDSGKQPDADLHAAARKVYLTYAEEAEALRQPVVDVFAENVAQINANAKFKQLLHDVPELSTALVFCFVSETKK